MLAQDAYARVRLRELDNNKNTIIKAGFLIKRGLFICAPLFAFVLVERLIGVWRDFWGGMPKGFGGERKAPNAAAGGFPLPSECAKIGK